MNFDVPISSVAIDPFFCNQGSGKRFIVGDYKITLHEKTFLARYKSTVLFDGDGQVKNIRWNENLVAWATDTSVRIFDMEEKVVICFIPEEDNLHKTDLLKCCLCWKNDYQLLIGWAKTVKVCNIVERSSEEAANKRLPKKYVVISLFCTIHSPISGIAPFDDHIVLLTSDNNLNDLHSEILIIKPFQDEFDEISSDILFPRGYKNYKCNDYNLEYLIDDGLFFIICPKDVIVARPREEDDHVNWLIDHHHFEEALNVVKNSGNVVKHSLLSVGVAYISDLLNQNDLKSWQKAASLCPIILEKNKEAWHSQVNEFHSRNKLGLIAPYLPTSPDFQLDRDIYELVLNDLLKNDSTSFSLLISSWPYYLYDGPKILKALMDELGHHPDNHTLLEALAKLHTYKGEHEKAVAIYLEIKNGYQAFDSIRKYNLTSLLQEKLEILMKTDANEASKLLIENQSIISIDDVVEKLKNQPKLLMIYLDRVIQKDVELCAAHHDLVIKIYAQYCPSKLLSFLKTSNHYSLEKTLDICQSHKLIPEVVFLLSRMGNTREALHYITEQMSDIDYAIEFCKEHSDSELWDDLINYSLKKPCFIRVLLQNIGTHIPNPIALIQRIPDGMVIEGLKVALLKILNDYNIQVALEESCKKLLVADCFKLSKKLNKLQKKGTLINENSVCQGCQRRILAKGILFYFDFLHLLICCFLFFFLEIQYTSDVVLFNCKYIFHEECLPASSDELSSLM